MRVFVGVGALVGLLTQIGLMASKIGFGALGGGTRVAVGALVTVKSSRDVAPDYPSVWLALPPPSRIPHYRQASHLP